MKHPMKLTTKRSQIVILACFTIAMLIGATNALSAAATPNPWTGGGGDFLWSNSGNWFEVQQVTDSAQFLTDVAATAPGVVNNIVDTDYTVQQLWYSPTNAYHTTQINPGVTLSVVNADTAATAGTKQSKRRKASHKTHEFQWPVPSGIR
jgi:hypothetical protein